MFQELSNVSKNVRILKFEIKTKQAWEILTQPKYIFIHFIISTYNIVLVNISK